MKYNKKLRLSPLFIAIVMSNAYAFEVPVANEDFSIRWDNTLRYNYAQRIEAQDPALLKNPNFDDGNRNFDKGMVSNRLDILSELDVVYQNKHGVRLSMAGWYDDAYRQSLDNTSPATSNHLNETGKSAIGFPNFVERYYQGPSGEILDAFAFTNVELANIPINIKAGRHTVYWGESLLLSGAIHGVSYGQAAVDAAKGFAVPGTEVKELFRPLNQLSAQMRIKSDLSLAMQYFFDWERYRLPDSGTYLGFNDALHESGESLILTPTTRVVRGEDSAPSGKGDMGLALRWSPEFLDGSVGFYARRLSDKLPQLHVRPAAAGLSAAACASLGYTTLPSGACYINPAAASAADLAAGRVGTYHLAYGDDIDLLGFSLAKGIAGVSVGVDLSYRKNMPLVSDIVTILPSAIADKNKGQISYLPTDGETGGARGDTLHGVVNLLGVVGGTPVWNQLTWSTELTWNRWQKVTQNEAVFKGRDNYSVLVDGVPSTLDKVSKDFFGMAANFTPMWYQVFPAVDLYLPLSVSVGLSGNSAVSLGGNEKSGTYSIGVGADVQQRYRVDLKYIDFLGEYQTNAAGMVQVSNGNPTQLKDRGMVTLTFKTTL